MVIRQSIKYVKYHRYSLIIGAIKVLLDDLIYLVKFSNLNKKMLKIKKNVKNVVFTSMVLLT